MTKRERFRISGRVQGVGFRAATLAEARRLGIGGWVCNLPDGQVEVLAQGETAALARFYAWLQQGPALAQVRQVERFSLPTDHVLPAGFHIR